MNINYQKQSIESDQYYNLCCKSNRMEFCAINILFPELTKLKKNDNESSDDSKLSGPLGDV